MTDEEEETRGGRETSIPQLDLRSICSELMRVVGKESVFKGTYARLVARRCSKPPAVGVSQQTDAKGHTPGASAGYQLRSPFGNYLCDRNRDLGRRFGHR